MNLRYFINKNSSLILSVCAGVGVITSTVLAVKATPKALELIEEEKEERGLEELSIKDTIRVTWKEYIPTGISIMSTLSCIFGSAYLNRRMQASLISAYTILNESYNNYIEKTKELYGEDADSKIKQEIVKSDIKEKDIIILDNIMDEKRTFFDMSSMQYFEATLQDVMDAEATLNRELAETGAVYLYRLYELLHIDTIVGADCLGWCDYGDYKPIKFIYDKMYIDGDMECIVIDTCATLI